MNCRDPEHMDVHIENSVSYSQVGQEKTATNLRRDTSLIVQF